jgi:hypothetical protein
MRQWTLTAILVLAGTSLSAGWSAFSVVKKARQNAAPDGDAKRRHAAE